MRISFVLFASTICFVFPACGGSDASSGSAKTNGGDSGAPNCDLVCPAVVSAHCALGPASQSDCVSGCQAILSGTCAPKYDALYQCAGPSPTYVCDSAGHVSVTGCESAASALYACLGA